MNVRVLAANPVLEAFGNAKTVRNNNSSRFGKWLEVEFDSVHGSIVGCTITNYLLERSRVVTPAADERNYHIFYQLTTAASDDIRAALQLVRDPSAYAYLSRSGCYTFPGASDAEDWDDVLTAFAQLGVSSEQYMQLFTVAAIALHLGNVGFRGSTKGAKTTPAPTSPTFHTTQVATEDGSAVDQADATSLAAFNAAAALMRVRACACTVIAIAYRCGGMARACVCHPAAGICRRPGVRAGASQGEGHIR